MVYLPHTEKICFRLNLSGRYNFNLLAGGKIFLLRVGEVLDRFIIDLQFHNRPTIPPSIHTTGEDKCYFVKKLSAFLYRVFTFGAKLKTLCYLRPS